MPRFDSPNDFGFAIWSRSWDFHRAYLRSIARLEGANAAVQIAKIADGLVVEGHYAGT